jgi:molybdenum-dependent DNA-binding transcriptional regulator ModE
MEFLTLRQAAKALGMSYDTLRKRVDQGVPWLQPTYVDPDSGRRSWNRVTLLAALDEMGREKARAS